MRESIFETLIGAIVVAVAGVFLWFALANGGSGGATGDQYTVTARFNNVAGVSRGSDVRMSGVKVGIVQSVKADYERAEAVLTLTLDKDLELADDADARITTDGLLGGSYVAVEQGGGFDVIPQDGTGEIIFTRGSVDLLTLFASFASGSGGDDSGSAAAPAPASDYPDDDYASEEEPEEDEVEPDSEESASEPEDDVEADEDIE